MTFGKELVFSFIKYKTLVKQNVVALNVNWCYAFGWKYFIQCISHVHVHLQLNAIHSSFNWLSQNYTCTHVCTRIRKQQIHPIPLNYHIFESAIKNRTTRQRHFIKGDKIIFQNSLSSTGSFTPLIVAFIGYSSRHFK